MKKILVIDDNDDLRENTAELLELSHYRVYTAENGVKGVEAAIRNKPDLIICDIMMPEMDGYGVLHMLQHIPELSSTPLVFLSAKTDNTDIRKGMSIGADDYLTKPFSTTDLLLAVETRLQKSEKLKNTLAPVPEEEPDPDSFKEKNALLQAFVEGRNLNRYKKKQVIFMEGNRPSRLYYLEKGKVKTYKSNESGKELVMSLYQEGDFFGYVAMLEGTNYKASAAAMEDSEIIEIPREEFEQMMKDHKGLTKRFIRMLAHHVSENESHLLALAYNSLRKKVADALLILSNKFRKNETGYFSIDISRDNLATIAGTATESLIRTLGDFREEQIIAIEDGKIIVLQEDKLRTMVN